MNKESIIVIKETMNLNLTYSFIITCKKDVKYFDIKYFE